MNMVVPATSRLLGPFRIVNSYGAFGDISRERAQLVLVQRDPPRAAVQTGIVGLSAHWRAVGGSFAQEKTRVHLGPLPPSARGPAFTR